MGLERSVKLREPEENCGSPAHINPLCLKRNDGYNWTLVLAGPPGPSSGQISIYKS